MMSIKIVWSVFLYFLINEMYFCDINVDIRIDANNSIGHLLHFWKSTGLSPPNSFIEETINFMKSKDMKLNLALIGSLPNRGIKQVRIHWLLDLVKIEKILDEGIKYNFTELDNLIKTLMDYNINPGFELMGNPSKFFNSFESQTEINYWYDLIKALATNYIDIYGIKKVSQWNFETWNEPDLQMFNKLHFTLKGYLNYINTTISALKDVSNQIHIGGPAGLFKNPEKHIFCWGALNWCHLLQKFNNSCPFSFISFHKKGNGTSDGVINSTIQTLNTIREKYSTIANFKFVNNEADILSGWWRNKDWRNDTRYASMIVKVIIDYIEKFKFMSENAYLHLISNDNAFLNYYPNFFSQRTLFSRFQINNTTPRHVQFFKKPVYIVMGFLSLMDDKQLRISVTKSSKFVHILATKSEKSSHYSIIITITNDTVANSKYKIDIKLNLENMPRSNYKYAIYTINNSVTNPAMIWKLNGALNFPDYVIRKRIRDSEGPYMIGGVRNARNKNELVFKLCSSIPSVFLINICSYENHSNLFKSKVTKLKLFNITYNEVLLTWSDKEIKSKCIKTYEIEFANQSKIFQRINEANTIYLSYIFSIQKIDTKIGNEEVKGFYRVRAVDYWDKKSSFSKIIHYV